MHDLDRVSFEMNDEASQYGESELQPELPGGTFDRPFSEAELDELAMELLQVRDEQELEQLAPFGLGNPDVTLLVPACQAVSPATVGEGKHLRFRVRQHGHDAGSAIAFGQGSQLDRLRAEGRFDVACRLKENHWNGTVAPQLVVRRLFDTPDAYESVREELAGVWQQGEEAWTADARRVFEELGLDPAQPSRRRQLLESDAFRALLEPVLDDEALPRAA